MWQVMRSSRGLQFDISNLGEWIGVRDFVRLSNLAAMIGPWSTT